MTAAEWDACADPRRMLEFLGDRAGPRKVRLFLAACCRQVWPLLSDRRSREAAEGAEAHADGQASGEQLRRARQRAVSAQFRVWKQEGGTARAPGAPAWGASLWPMVAADEGTRYLRVNGAALGGALAPEVQAGLLRDVIGNPFRPPPPIDPAWLAWNGRTVEKLARLAYEERQLPSGHLDSHCLAVLADALEEAGCEDAELLEHLRSGVHVRGCWCVDAILGRG